MLSKLLRNSEPSIPLTAYYSDRNLYLAGTVVGSH